MAFRKKTLGLIERIVSTASSGGNLALANNSRTYQQITGTLAHTVTLPQANAASPNECPVGLQFTILNRSTGAVTVNFFGGALAKTLDSNTQATFRLVDNSTSAGTWDATNEAAGSAGNSLTEEQKSSALAALGTAFYQDESITTKTANVNPEEIGGNYWSTKPVLSTVRRLVGAASLNGYAYATGGNGVADARVDTVERYDGDGNHFLSRQSLPTVLSFHAAFSASGKLYVAGGFDASVRIATTRYYDDATNTWALRASLSAARSSMTGVVVNDTPVLPAGNDTNPLVITQQYDTAADAWYVRANLATPKVNSCSLASFDKVYSIAGETTGFALTNLCYVFDLAANYWSSISNLPISRSNGPGFSVLGVGHAVGGSVGVGTPNTTNYQLNFDSNTWTTLAPKTTGTYDNFGAGTGLNGVGLIFGGNDASGLNLSVVESYVGFSFYNVFLNKKDNAVPSALYVAAALNNVTGSVPARLRTDGDTWKYFEANKDSVLRVSESLSKKFLESGELFVAGGDSANGASVYTLNDFYNPIANTWTARQAFVTGKTVVQSFKLNGYAHLAGGNTSGGTVATNDRFNEVLNTWDTRAVLPVGKASGSGFNLNGYGYAVAGGNGGLLLTNYRYDADADSWSTMTAITSVAAQAAGMALLGRGYVINGSSTGSFGNNQNLNQQYNDITNAWTAKTGSSNGRTGPGGFAIGNFGYISGGFYSGSFSQVTTERYDPSLDSWAGRASITSGRSALGGAQSGSAGYVYGGQVGTTPSAVVDKYNDDANTYTAVASLGTARTAPSANFTPGPYRNYELQIGVPTYLASVGSGQWVTRSNMVLAKAPHNNFTIGEICFAGGGNDASGPARTNDLQSYTPYTDSWRTEAPGPLSPGDLGGFSNGNTLYGKGFQNGHNASGSLDGGTALYDPAIKAWSVAATGGGSGQGNETFVLNGFGYSASGGPGVPAHQLSTYRYNPNTNSWSSSVATLGSIHYAGSCAVMNGFTFITGGSPSSVATEMFDDAAATWVSKANITVHIESVNGFVLADGWHIAAAYNGGPTTNHQVYRSDLNLWSVNTVYPISNSQVGSGTVSDGAFTFGGNNGSYLTNTYKWASAIKNIVLGAGLRVD